jgi:hypothetical protein
MPLSIGLLVFIVWRLRLQHEVNTKLALIKAAGLPTSGVELNAFYPAVPDAENAALVLAKAISLWRTYPDKRSGEVAFFKLPQRGQPLSLDEKALLSGYVQMNTHALAKARESFNLPRSRFSLDYSLGVLTPLPHLAGVKRLAQLAQFESLLATDAGRWSEACRSIQTIMGCATTLEGEPDFLSQLVRVAIVAIGTATLEYIVNVGELTEADLSELATTFASVEKTNLFSRALIAERAMYVSKNQRGLRCSK